MNIVQAIRKLAAEHPDNVYKRPDGGVCFYSRGECTDGSCGCIVGQALKMLCYDTAEIDRRVSRAAISGGRACYVLPALGIGTAAERDWVSAVQVHQDKGATWGRAVMSADYSRPLPVAA